MKGVSGSCKRCRQHNGAFGVQMRCLGHRVKGVFGGRKGCFRRKVFFGV